MSRIVFFAVIFSALLCWSARHETAGTQAVTDKDFDSIQAYFLDTAHFTFEVNHLVAEMLGLTYQELDTIMTQIKFRKMMRQNYDSGFVDFRGT